ncbi:MAG TPA: VanW family protein, partial [Clostridia bacterium]
MKFKSIIINTLLSTFLITALTGCNSSLSEKNGNISGNPDGNEKKQTNPKQEPDNPSEASRTVPSTKVQNEEVIKSGEITSVPWENDSEFTESIKKNNTPVLMAAYRTVLKDPLPGEEENVHLGARMLKGKVLMPGEVFSQNKSIGPYTTERGFRKGPTYVGSTLTTTIGGGVCKIASTLYNTTVLSNLKVEERYAHGMPVPYVPYGQDATVAYGSRDFKFRNTENFPVTIWAQGIDNV